MSVDVNDETNARWADEISLADGFRQLFALLVRRLGKGQRLQIMSGFDKRPYQTPIEISTTHDLWQSNIGLQPEQLIDTGEVFRKLLLIPDGIRVINHDPEHVTADKQARNINGRL